MKESLVEFSDNVLPIPFQPDWAKLEGAGSEGPFMDAAVELCKELGILVAFAGGIFPEEPLGFKPRNEGIVRALLVRTSKLINRLVGETCEFEEISKPFMIE